MHKLLLGLSILATASVASAMPEGTVTCATKDGKTSIDMTVSNYGEHVIESVDSLQINGKSIETFSGDKALISIGRQWMDANILKLDIALPAGTHYFSRSLVIETKISSTDPESYIGTGVVEVRKNDYSDPLVTVERIAMTCTYEP